MEIKGPWSKVSIVLNSTVAPGDPVRTDADNGGASICVAAETKQPLGLASEDGVSGETILMYVPQNRMAVVKYPLENAYAATQHDIKYSLVGTTGAFYVNNDDTTQDFWLMTPDRDGCSTTQGWVTFASLVGEAVS